MKYLPSEDIIVDVEVNETTIEIAFAKWLENQPRYKMLKDYYLGNHYFNEEIHGEDQNRIIANHCKYITDVLVGYQFGNEPRYDAPDGDTAGQAIIDLMREQDKWQVDLNIGESLSIYGRTNELVYMPKDKDVPNSMEIDPMHGFVAKAGDVEKDAVFGVVVFEYTDNNKRQIYRLYVYDRADVSIWECEAKANPRAWRMVDGPTPHGFGRVPVVEYKNNRLALSDFESIIELQDAYNSLLSDRQDNQDSFAQAMLVLAGSALGHTQEEMKEGKKFLKKTKILQVDEDTVAQYLVKTTDEAGVQVIQDQLASDIHKFAMVPDLSDEQFAGNASGVAMAYKLFGTDQVVSKKQSMMQRGFTIRCKLYDYRINNPSLNPSYTYLADVENMTITFNLNSVQDLSYIATALSQLVTSKVLSLQTARTLVSAIPDPDEETERVRQESEEEAKRIRDTYDSDQVAQDPLKPKTPTAPTDEDEDEDSTAE